MESLIKGLLGVIGAIERVAIGIAMVMMFAIMVIVASDVFMRYVFNSPFAWAYDLISLYLMAGVFFLAVSQAYGAGAHVSVDILQQTFPPRAKRLSECVTCIVGLVAFALVARFSFDRALDAYQSQDVIAGSIPWPTWPSIALVPLGTGLLCLRLAVTLLGQLASLATGRDIIPAVANSHDTGEVFE
ncbi:C4-dicarboxylate ABC transporter permease [Azorhizobium oxalatiphilum]|uniref:TRAP transporter small permease protein n=1 Tax=Azorhizobium oxalatiphilum TaxID=980631 RepID=A0A917C2N1_9HYPH|nr:TRAP transporter small permease [Azorhizobium oxalatiphilum]GGF68980.1 C4-dicarboxylate ABC transporter permease [Azorhizobium oxalatiphilum]